MKRRVGLWRSVVASCAWLFVSRSAAAQRAPAVSEAPSEASTREARALFEQGLTAADGERWGEAVLFFQRSLALVARPSTRLNLGNALVRMGRVLEARRALETFLSEADPVRDRERIGRARAMLSEARAAVAELSVRPQPDGVGASVTNVAIDGVAREDFTLREGLLVLEVDPGAHRVTVRGRDGAEGDASVTLLPGARVDVQVSLRTAPPPVPMPIEPREARVHFVGAPTGAIASIDGSTHAVSAAGLVVAPGEHQIELRSGAVVLLRRRVRVEPAARLELLVLRADETPAPPRSVFTRPAFWAVGGSLVAAGVAGAVLGVLMQPRWSSTGQTFSVGEPTP